MSDETQAPHTLPPLPAVDQSGHAASLDDAVYDVRHGAPGAAHTLDLPHPETIKPTAPGLGVDLFPDVDGDSPFSPYEEFARMLNSFRDPRPMPWEFRGPLLGASPNGTDIKFNPVPPGEIWEIERTVIQCSDPFVWKIYDGIVSNLLDSSEVADGTGAIACYQFSYSPPIRIGAGSTVGVQAVSGNKPYSVRIQYRFMRIPRPGSPVADAPIREP